MDSALTVVQARTALEEAVSRHERELASFAFRLVGTEDSARDCLQDAFLRAVGAIAEGARPENPRPWLYRLVYPAPSTGSVAPPSKSGRSIAQAKDDSRVADFTAFRASFEHAPCTRSRGRTSSTPRAPTFRPRNRRTATRSARSSCGSTTPPRTTAKPSAGFRSGSSPVQLA